MEEENVKLSIIIPVYNSEDTIGCLVEKLLEIIDTFRFEIVLINDCSKDNSHNICLEKHNKYSEIVSYIRLSKNFSEHNAVMAGLNYSKGYYALIMDDDFQNPPEEAVKVALFMFDNQFDVLYTYYDKKEHNWFRNLGSKFNDWVGTILLDKPKDLYLSSFKCVNRFVINEIIKYKGPYPYIDGLILRFTRNIGKIEVKHDKRSLGKSGYTLRKLVSLWVNMFVNFSNIPLRLSFLMGCILTIFGVLMELYFLADKYIFHFQENVWPLGWATLLVCIITFSGAQLISLGLLGEYVGKLYLMSNKTPQFVITDSFGRNKTK